MRFTIQWSRLNLVDEMKISCRSLFTWCQHDFYHMKNGFQSITLVRKIPLKINFPLSHAFIGRQWPALFLAFIQGVGWLSPAILRPWCRTLVPHPRVCKLYHGMDVDRTTGYLCQFVLDLARWDRHVTVNCKLTPIHHGALLFHAGRGGGVRSRALL